MRIYVKFRTGLVLQIEVEPSSRIEEVKMKIQDREGFPLYRQLLMFNGRELQNEKSLSDHYISKESTILFLFRERKKIRDPNMDDACIRIINHIQWYQNLRDDRKKKPIELITVFQELCDTRENGPLLHILMFMDLISHVTNLPLVSRSFHSVSLFCLSKGLLASTSKKVYEISLLLGKCRDEDKVYPSEKLLLEIVFKIMVDKGRFNFNLYLRNQEIIKFMFEKKYFEAARYYCKRWIHRVEHDRGRHKDLQTPVETFFKLAIDSEQKDLIELILHEKFAILNSCHLQSSINIIGEKKFFEVILSDPETYKFFLKPTEIRKLCGYFLSKPGVWSSRIFCTLFKRYFPTDQYDIDYTPENSDFLNLENWFGLKYRMEEILKFLQSINSHDIHSIEQINNLIFLCSSQFDIHPNEERKKIIKQYFAIIPEDRRKHYLREAFIPFDERFEEITIYRNYVSQKDSVDVYQFETSEIHRKNATIEFLNRFWFNGTKIDSIRKHLLDFLVSKESQNCSWLMICPYRFEIEKNILEAGDDFKKEKLERMLEEYNKENDPLPELPFHKETILKVKKNEKMKEVIIRSYSIWLEEFQMEIENPRIVNHMK